MRGTPEGLISRPKGTLSNENDQGPWWLSLHNYWHPLWKITNTCNNYYFEMKHMDALYSFIPILQNFLISAIFISAKLSALHSSYLMKLSSQENNSSLPFALTSSCSSWLQIVTLFFFVMDLILLNYAFKGLCTFIFMQCKTSAGQHQPVSLVWNRFLRREEMDDERI